MKNMKFIFIVFFVALSSCLNASGGREEDTFSYSGISALSVEGSFFEIDIIGQSRNEVEAEITIPDRLRDRGVKVLHDRQGSELRVWVEVPRLSFARTSGSRMRFIVPDSTIISPLYVFISLSFAPETRPCRRPGMNRRFNEIKVRIKIVSRITPILPRTIEV